MNLTMNRIGTTPPRPELAQQSARLAAALARVPEARREEVCRTAEAVMLGAELGAALSCGGTRA